MDEINLRGILDVAIKTAEEDMTLAYSLFIFKTYPDEAESFINNTLPECPLKKLFNKALAVLKENAADAESSQKILKAFREETLLLLTKGTNDVA